MRLEFLMLSGILVNLLMVAMFPSAILGPDNIYGLEVDTDYNFGDTEQFSNDDYKNSISSNTINNHSTEQLTSILNAQEEAQPTIISSITDSVSGFFDWVSIGFGILKDITLFLVPFISFIWMLSAPFNYVIGGVYLLLYIMGIAKFLIGR